jgi:cholesterol transport system auxiliary component
MTGFRQVVLIGALVIGGCGPLVQIGGNAKTPASLLTLRAEPAASASTSGAPVVVALPSVPGALRTTRVPVATAQTELAYLKDANWIEQPNQLFQRLLADVLQAKTGRPALDERSATTPAGLRLSGRLAEFGLDVRGAAPQVRVRFDALLTGPGGRFIAAERFEATGQVDAETGTAVARALNLAANAVAGDIATWLQRSAAEREPNAVTAR